MADSPWRDKDQLYKLYVEEGLSAAAIGEKLGCSDTTVLDWLDRHDISKRNPDPPTKSGRDHPRSVTRLEIIRDYRRLANELGKTPSQMEYDDEGEHSSRAIKSHFEGMRDLQEAAGLEPLKKGRVTIECELCGETKRVKHANRDTRFCSNECANKWKSDAYSGAQHHNYAGEVNFTCEWCGQAETFRKSEAPERFCSQACMLEWRSTEYSGEGHPRWKNNGRYYRGANWHTQREKARERDNHKCQQCGKESGEESHDVHHIIPFEEFDDHERANRLENLITLCKSCHQNVEWGNISVQSNLETFSE
jgi:endogenous inhibitor of DNA gyrase (YacG/DUF329 family)/transposase-like protein